MKFFLFQYIFFLFYFTSLNAQKAGVYLLQSQVYNYEDGKRTLNEKLSIESLEAVDSLLSKSFIENYQLSKYNTNSIGFNNSDNIKKAIIDKKNNYLIQEKLSDSIKYLIDKVSEKKVVFLLVTGRERENITTKSYDAQKKGRIAAAVVGTTIGNLMPHGYYLIIPGTSPIKPLDQLATVYCLIFDKTKKKIIYAKTFSDEYSPMNLNAVNDLLQIALDDCSKYL